MKTDAEMITTTVAMLTVSIRAALATCDVTGSNLPDLLSSALTAVALDEGSFRLIEHRPGSWEATHVEALDLSSLYRDEPV